MVNEQKILTIVLIIITLLLVPLYYYSSSSFSSITGRVTAEPATSTPQKVGEYSIKGDFTIDLNQNFDDYKTMRTNARLMLDGVLNCEQDKQISLEDCIKEVNTSLNLEWSTSCEDEKIAYFYEIVESYMQCANSNDNYCFCEFPINFNEEIE
ncbi:hypothetical protein HN415_01005, partial [Candidatus Woesearchaeota archaeon]|nr:hypothetical protein [Candidatus Woesearchaeota archaeon]